MSSFIVGVPYTDCKYASVVPCTREDEALAVAFGAYLAGENPEVFMQADGIGHCIDFICSVMKPANVEILLHIHLRNSPEQHEYLGKIFKPLMKVLDYASYTEN